MLWGTLHLLHGGSGEDALQTLVHLTNRIGGGCGQRVPKHGRRGRIFTSLGEGGELPLHPFHCCGPACLRRRFTLAHLSEPGLNSHPFIGKLTSSPCGFSFDVVL
jgi:hypothetical protein